MSLPEAEEGTRWQSHRLTPGLHGEAVVLQPMVRIGLAVIHGDVHRCLETPGVGGHLDRCPECHGAEVIRDEAPALSLRGTGLRLRMADGLDGFTDIIVITDPVPRGGH